MHSKELPYQGHIEALLCYINSMIQKDWRNETPDAFNKALGIETLSQIASMSVRNLHLIFKSYMNETLHQYIIRLRMEYAMLLLKDNKMTLTEISEHIGFFNPQALSNTFQKKYHITPTNKQTELLQNESTYPYSILPYRITEQKETSILFFHISENTKHIVLTLLKKVAGTNYMNMPNAMDYYQRKRNIGVYVTMIPILPI